MIVTSLCIIVSVLPWVIKHTAIGALQAHDTILDESYRESSYCQQESKHWDKEDKLSLAVWLSANGLFKRLGRAQTQTYVSIQTPFIQFNSIPFVFKSLIRLAHDHWILLKGFQD